MGKSPPKPTPPKETAAAQTGTNVSTAIANSILGNMTEVTPYGTRNVEQTGMQTVRDLNTGKSYEIPTYTATTRLSEMQGRINDAQEGASLSLAQLGQQQADRLKQALGGGIDLSNLPGAGQVATAPNLQTMFRHSGDITRSYGTDFSEDRQRVEDALMSRLQPSLERDREALRTRLVNQGINEGSDAFDRAMSRFGEQSNDARMQAILAGGAEQSRLADLEARRAAFQNAAQGQAFSQDLGRAGFANSARQQDFGNDRAIFADQSDARERALQEQFALRNQPINETSVILHGGQVSQPQFSTTPRPATIPGTDVGSIIANADAQKMNAWAQGQAAGGSLLSGLGGLAGTLFTLSDERAKADKKKIGETGDGLGIYSFRYKGEPKTTIGLMAQEVAKKKPHAVARDRATGLMAVDYKEALR